jgi:hypothetical protein
MTVPLVGWINAKNALLSVLVKLRFAPHAPLLRVLWIFTIFVKVFLNPAMLSPISMMPLFLYNDNDARKRWSHIITSKGAGHIEPLENSVCEWVQDKTILVKHVAGKINPADIFTKEMRDGPHFWCLHNFLMS